MKEFLDGAWSKALAAEFESDYWSALENFVNVQRREHVGKIYPPADEVFAAMKYTPLDQVKVVLLGQDPYHGPGQAHGLSFSVPVGVKTPPSLKNILKELQADVGCAAPGNGSLIAWAQRGVLLLNTVLTVRDGEANSHRKQGWERFTDAIIGRLNLRTQPVVFLLWGAPANKKQKLIDLRRHAVIESVHPSPLSAHRGFFGSRPFSKVNAALATIGASQIDWQL